MLEAGKSFQKINVVGLESKRAEMLETFIQSSKNGVFASKGILSEKEFKDGPIFMSFIEPVCVGHGDLIQIRQHGRHQRIRWRSGRHDQVKLVKDCASQCDCFSRRQWNGLLRIPWIAVPNG